MTTKTASFVNGAKATGTPRNPGKTGRCWLIYVTWDAVLNADETGWKERGKTLWLWTFVTKTTAYFKMGRRTIDVLDSVIGMVFASWLMSDGYAAYRHHPNRLRCQAHQQSG